MVTKKYHLQEQSIPDGFEIFEDRLEVAGIQFRKNDAIAFAEKSDEGWLEFERDQNNQYDKNAIKLIGCHKSMFGESRRFIGYVLKEISQLIIEGGFQGIVKPRLLKTYVSDGGFVEILFQVLCPKGRKYQFKQIDKVKRKHVSDYVDRVNQLLREKKESEAIELLLKLVDMTEKEAKNSKSGIGVAPWCYNQLAKIYRKQKRYQEEVEILERYDQQPKSPGSLREDLAKRLVEARKFLIEAAPNTGST